MQIKNLEHNKKNIKAQTFTGYKDFKKPNGMNFIKFFAPAYDKNKYELSLEIVPLKQKGSKWICDNSKILYLPKSVEQFKNDGTYCLSKDFLTQSFSDNFGYRYKLTSKSNGDSTYLYDAGVKSDDDNFNVISSSHGYSGGISGPMYHMFINSFAPSDNAKENMKTRNHFNDAEGNIQGVIDKLKSSDILDPYSLILSTPIFGADNVSSHGYWSANPYQLSTKAGNLEDFKELQETLFDKGKGWIADGVFASHSFNSPQVQDVLKHGKNSPFYNWFRLSDNNIKLGILPSGSFGFKNSDKENKEALNHCSYKIITKTNGSGAKAYYIQFYDDRLATKEQINSNDFIEKYNKYQADDIYEIKNNSDSIQPYCIPLFNIDKNKLSELKEFERQPLSLIKDPQIFNFDNFSITTKEDAKNANFWDGNIDLVKLNLSNPKDKSGEIGSIQARNYAYGAAKYWTKNTSNTLLNYVAQNLANNNKEQILNKISKTYNINLNEIKNATDAGIYENSFLDNTDRTTFLEQEILNFPLESLDMPKDITSILSSPYVTPRPMRKEDETLSPYDLQKNGDYYSTIDFYDSEISSAVHDFKKTNAEMLKLYKGEITNFVLNVFKEIDNNKLSDLESHENLILEDDGKTLTSYGVYVAKILVPEILRYAITNAIFKDNHPINVEDGKLSVDYNTIKENNFDTLYPNSLSFPSCEAEKVVEGMKDAFKNSLGQHDIEKLSKLFGDRLKNVSLKDFELAQAIVEQTHSGLNWRFDAAKDIGDIDSVRTNDSKFESVWDETIDFWQNFVKNIKDENPSSYIIGEVTDLWGLYNQQKSNFGKYENPDIAERMFLEKTGITTDTNYSHAFSSIPAFFGQVFENGDDSLYANMGALKGRMENYLNFGPYSMIVQSHIALNNHDKPRPLHTLALDNKLFLNGAYINKWTNEDDARKLREDIKERTKKMFPDIPFNKVNPKAVALCEIYIKNFAKCIEDKETRNFIIDVTKMLALGKNNFGDKPNFEKADAFCSDEFENSLKHIFNKAEDILLSKGYPEDAMNLRAKSSEYISKMLENILDVPMERYSKMWEMMATMFGNPTLYAGDEYAQTGFEYPSGNNTVKNRNIIRHEVLDDKTRPSILAYNKKMKAISNLSKKQGLSALNSGAPVSLKQDNDNLWAIYKNDDKNSEVITLYSTAGLKARWDEKQDKNPGPITVDYIKLDGLKGGIDEGVQYSRLVYDEKTASYIDNNEKYITSFENGSYVLKRKDGKPVDINSTTTIFYKKQEPKMTDILNMKYNI